jgi:hypothetical protein
MKTNLLLLFLFLMPIYSQAQHLEVRIDTIEAIVIHEFTSDYGWFKEKSYFVYEGDTLLFDIWSSWNCKYIEKYPYFKESLGEASTYKFDYIDELTDKDFTHYLGFSQFNYHSAFDRTIESPIFYKKENDDHLYSVYHFYGSVVFYDGVDYISTWPERKEEDEIYALLNSCDFLPQQKVNQFVILKEAMELKPLTLNEEKEFQLLRSGIRMIEHEIYE